MLILNLFSRHHTNLIITKHGLETLWQMNVCVVLLWVLFVCCCGINNISEVFTKID